MIDAMQIKETPSKMIEAEGLFSGGKLGLLRRYGKNLVNLKGEGRFLGSENIEKDGSTFETSFDVDHLVGRGDLCFVLKGKRFQDDGEINDAALKIFYPAKEIAKDTRELRTLFNDEANLLELADHPHVAKFYGRQHFSIDTTSFDAIARELFPDSLKDLAFLSPEQLSADRIIEVVQQIGSALDYLANDGKIGKILVDLSLSNIGVRENGEVALMDLNVAGGKGEKLGTLGVRLLGNHIAPELVMGFLETQQVELKETAEVYELALIAYQLLGGKLPSEFDLAHSKVVYQHLAGISDEFDSVLSKALSVDPSERFPTVREFLDELSSLKKNAQVVADEPQSVPA